MNFDDIRPYTDAEVPMVVERLLNNREFIDTLVGYALPAWAQPFGFALRPLVKYRAKKRWGRMTSVKQIQGSLDVYIKAMLKRSTDGFSVSGSQNLQPGKSYLFVSNHRDIVLDPALVNMALFKLGRETVRIAIGDNLLTKPFIEDMMRLNKSFIVKRSVTNPRQKLKELGRLSQYIRESVKQGESVWIAQREGRAKDGMDMTDPAIIKMFHLSGRAAKQDLSNSINELEIVPVAISYELDPLAEEKARELDIRERTGDYEKEDHEDIQSIVNGILGHKGQIHVAFGEPVKGEFDTPEQVAEAIDKQIACLYKLFPTNYAAEDKSDQEQLMRMLDNVPQDLHSRVLTMYANPVHRAKSYQSLT